MIVTVFPSTVGHERLEAPQHALVGPFRAIRLPVIGEVLEKVPDGIRRVE